MSENFTVYVVDDDPGALESLRWMLEQADYRVGLPFKPGLPRFLSR